MATEQEKRASAASRRQHADRKSAVEGTRAASKENVERLKFGFPVKDSETGNVKTTKAPPKTSRGSKAKRKKEEAKAKREKQGSQDTAAKRDRKKQEEAVGITRGK